VYAVGTGILNVRTLFFYLSESPLRNMHAVMMRTVEFPHNGVAFEGWSASTMSNYVWVHGPNEEALTSKSVQ
jgi:hypothetical protein